MAQEADDVVACRATDDKEGVVGKAVGGREEVAVVVLCPADGRSFTERHQRTSCQRGMLVARNSPYQTDVATMQYDTNKNIIIIALNPRYFEAARKPL